ncbi:hypothetical protein U9M48_026102 [Paspalum notatum var. saurae]|uniref:Uncharacterized protein n=1 Tax=Paspalum notatum var. saurae TaxID=547442 RepID=A0AAQ3WY10_PASNO
MVSCMVMVGRGRGSQEGEDICSTVLGPDVVKDCRRRRLRAQLALEQCCLPEDDVVDLLLGGDDGGLPRRVDGQAGIDGGGPSSSSSGLPRSTSRVEAAEAGVPEGAEHPPARRRRPLQRVAGDVPGGVGDESPGPGRGCSDEHDGHMFVIYLMRLRSR